MQGDTDTKRLVEALVTQAEELLEAYESEPDGFADADVALLRRLGGAITAQMTRPSDFSDLQDDRHDVLTGLPNRRFFEEHLVTEVARARQLGAPLTLCLFDLDGFKRVNESHGHACGDEVLQAVARGFATVRAGDIAFRTGGDEFALVLPGAGESDAERVAHRIATAIGTDPDCMGVTASWGAATLEESDPQRFLARADAALYAAKRVLGIGR